MIQKMIVQIRRFKYIYFFLIFFGCNEDEFITNKTNLTSDELSYFGIFKVNLAESILGSYNIDEDKISNLELHINHDGTFYLNQDVNFIKKSKGTLLFKYTDGFSFLHIVYGQENGTFTTDFVNKDSRGGIFIEYPRSKKGYATVEKIYFNKISQ